MASGVSTGSIFAEPSYPIHRIAESAGVTLPVLLHSLALVADITSDSIPETQRTGFALLAAIS